MKLHYVLCVTSILFITLLTPSLARKYPNNDPKGDKAKKLKIVFTKKLLQQQLFDRYAYPARILSRINATIHAETEGLVSELKRGLGEKIKKNQVLTFIEPTAHPNYHYQAVQVKSPISGVVAKIFVGNGAFVKKGDAILTLVDPSKLKILIEVPILELNYLKVRAKGMLTLHYLSKKIEVIIVGIAPAVDASTGTATVELRMLSAKDLKYVRIGSLGQVSFKTNLHRGIMVPQHAIVYRGKQTQMRLVKNSVMERVDITLGERREAEVEVVSGLNVGDEMILRSSGFIKAGEKVQVKK